MRRNLLRLAATAFLACTASAAWAQDTQQLAPYQIVRSLQLVQDRIADGDQPSLPMQRKILELIDQRLRAASSDEFSDPRNFRALMIYAMSGGNPRTVEQVYQKLILSQDDGRLAAGVIRYIRGEPGSAWSLLQNVEPATMSSEIAPFLSLVKGSLVALKDAQAGLKLLDYARLTGPGTLVEEAALRRSMALAVQVNEPRRFERAAEQYSRRFLRSPYASQFADAFVAGVVDLHAGIDLASVTDTIGNMTEEQAKVAYLRIARRAAIDRLPELMEFTRRALEGQGEDMVANDARAQLYTLIAEVASDQPLQVRKKLQAVDRQQLSSSDRALLDAALDVVSSVISLPKEPVNGPGAIASEVAADMASAPPGGAQAKAAAPGATPASGPAAVVAAKPAPDDPGAIFVKQTRSKLDEIDALLKGKSK